MSEQFPCTWQLGEQWWCRESEDESNGGRSFRSDVERNSSLKIHQSFKNKLFPREAISRVCVVEGSQLVLWLHNTLHNVRNNARRRRDADGSEMPLTCSPLRFLKSFSLISVILLFCRSSRVVSSGMSPGTDFRPDGKRHYSGAGSESQHHHHNDVCWKSEFEMR